MAAEDGMAEDGVAAGTAAGAAASMAAGTARGIPTGTRTTIPMPILTLTRTRIRPLPTRLLRFPSPANRSSRTGTTVRIQMPIIRT
jgi:hypothetical protein